MKHRAVCNFFMMLAIAFMVFAFVWSCASKDENRARYIAAGAGCAVKVPGVDGMLCQQRDVDGSIYYTNGIIKVEVLP